MPAAIKAVVFKTPQLKATRVFFEQILNFPIKESSVRHFVIYSNDIRVVFLATSGEFETEVYMTNSSLPADLKSYKDPNNINIIITKK